MASDEKQEPLCMSVSSLLCNVMLHKIFPLLPVKTLARFKCVCKLWLKAISNPKFAKSHLMLQSPGLVYIRQRSILHFKKSTDDETESYKIDLSNILGDAWVAPLGSCNGLVLVRRVDHEVPSRGYGTHGNINYIVNPITRRYLKLPTVHPFTECFMHFDNRSNEYTVLGWNSQPNRSLYVLVLSDCNNVAGISWRKFKLPEDLMVQCHQPTLLDEWYHWTVAKVDSNGKWSGNEKLAILAFNIGRGEFKVMKVPDAIVSINGWSYRLVTVEDSLHLIQYHWPGERHCYIIWRLDDHEQQVWTKVCRYKVECCQKCRECGWGNMSSALTSLFLDVEGIIKKGRKQNYGDIVHTNSLVWLDNRP